MGSSSSKKKKAAAAAGGDTPAARKSANEAAARKSQTGAGRKSQNTDAMEGRKAEDVEKDLKNAEKLAAIQAKIKARKENEVKGARAAAMRKTQMEMKNRGDMEDRIKELNNARGNCGY